MSNLVVNLRSELTQKCTSQDSVVPGGRTENLTGEYSGDRSFKPRFSYQLNLNLNILSNTTLSNLTLGLKTASKVWIFVVEVTHVNRSRASNVTLLWWSTEFFG